MLRLLLLCPLLLSACYDSADAPGPRPETPAVNTTLTELRRLYAGKTFEIKSDLLLEGLVTSHDRASNFYRTLMIEDDGAAAEVMAGIDGLHNIYPLGHRITINLNGLAIGDNHGILQIGRMPASGSGYATDYIGSRAALDRHLSRGSDYSAPEPLVTDLPSLAPVMAGRLVRIDGLRYSPDQPEPDTWSGTHRFTDDDENVVYTYTRTYADFANNAIPAREVVLIGILQCDGTRYTLRLRDETDCWY